MPVHPDKRRVATDSDPVDPQNYASAILNILDDFVAEKGRLDATQRAVVNILEDSAEEKRRVDDTQRAILNILEDAAGEQVWSDATQRAILNVLEDSAEEKERLADTQRAALNILDDFDIEKKKVEQANADLRNEIAERARAEEALRHAKAAAEEASRELEAFSYSVAHDLRAPLRGIDGFSQALIEDCAEKLDEMGKTYLGYVRESAQHMAQLIDDLLSLSRVTRAELHRMPIDLAAIAKTVFTNLQRSQPDRKVEFIMPRAIAALGDARLLGIVVENLLGNAWKFTGKHAHARIEFGRQPQANRWIYFIRDNGAGFDMAYAGKLFAVFQRLHTVSEFEGTGIGLATVQRIIRRHGGRVWAEGEVGRGATFYFTLEEGT
jgi:signal transduction histidine kinase